MAKQIRNKKPVTQVNKAEVKVNTEQMRANLTEAITRLNEVMRDGGRGLNFAVDHVLGAPIVLVRNSDTGEVIRQIPNEVVVRVAHSIEALKGMLHNQTT
jgi:flagellar protein FlaG